MLVSILTVSPKHVLLERGGIWCRGSLRGSAGVPLFVRGIQDKQSGCRAGQSLIQVVGRGEVEGIILAFVQEASAHVSHVRNGGRPLLDVHPEGQIR